MQDKLIVFNPKSNPTSNYYAKLNKEDKEVLDKFEKYCLVSANPIRAKKSKGNALRFLLFAQTKLKDISLEDLQNFLRLIKSGNLSDYFKNDIRGNVKRFLKWHFKDWSERFNNFEDVKYISEPQRKKAINPEDVLSKEQVEQLVKAEKTIFWKAFLVLQYQGCLRTLETRTIKWDMLNTEDSDVYWLNIKSKKNKSGIDKERVAPPLNSQAIYFLDELKKWQKETNNVSPYVFPSREGVSEPISASTTNKWFSRLTKKVFGKSMNNYLLRHSGGEALHKLVREGTLSKENALLMMGHSEKMFDKTYSHSNKKELIKLLKKQVLNVDYIAPERKLEMEKRIEAQQKEIDNLKQSIPDFQKKIIAMIDPLINKIIEDDMRGKIKYDKKEMKKLVEMQLVTSGKLRGKE